MEIDFEYALVSFESYFLRRAKVSDELAHSGSVIDSLILSTTALDALAKIWLHDFPEIERNYVNGISESIRLSQLLKQFAKDDPDASKVAVVCFAEDWKLYHPEDTSIADQLLNRRLSDDPHGFPKSSLDVPLNTLEQECPLIAQCSKLRRIAEEYEYGAMLYKFYRCPLVHSSKRSDRTNGLAHREEIMYYWSYVDSDRSTIGFSPHLITRWLQTVSTNYVKFCREKAVIPAENLNAGLIPENGLKKRWSKL